MLPASVSQVCVQLTQQLHLACAFMKMTECAKTVICSHNTVKMKPALAITGDASSLTRWQQDLLG